MTTPAPPDGWVAPLPRTEALGAAQGAGVPEGLARLNVFGVLLRRPEVAKGVAELLLSLLGSPALDPRLRELAIMRLGWTTGSVYEWSQHWPIALALGVDAADLLAVRDWEHHAGFGEVERAVLAATDECTTAGAVSGATMAVLRGHLDDRALVDLVTAIGAWTMVSVFLRSLGVPLEDGMAPWPPTGEEP